MRSRMVAAAVAGALAATLWLSGCRQAPPPPTMAQKEDAVRKQIEKIRSDPNKTAAQKESEIKLLISFAASSK